VAELAERYAEPLPQIEREVAELRAKVAAHLERMGFGGEKWSVESGRVESEGVENGIVDSEEVERDGVESEGVESEGVERGGVTDVEG